MNPSAILKPHLLSAVVLTLLLVAQAASLLAPFDRHLADSRYRFGDRPPSGDIVFIAIDKQSLDAVGVWPWPRKIHAALTNRLHDLGARDIMFDVDFSTRSNPVDDDAFADAIDRAEGTVTLPVFLQYGEAGEEETAPIVTQPVAEIARNAWLATVNVFPDADSRFRSFPTGQQAGEAFISSIPATMAGVTGSPDETIHVDFGIDLESVPAISVRDILAGKVERSQIEGKSVLIGAYAAELNDFFAVPRYGFIAGPMLQIAAGETLLADRNLRVIDPMPIALAAFALLLVILAVLRNRKSKKQLLSFAVIPFITEPAAILLYARFGVMVPTAFIHVSVLSAIAIRSLSMTELFRVLLRKADAHAGNMQVILEQVVSENFDAIVILDADANVLQASEAVRDIFDVGEDLPQAGEPASSFLPDQLAREVKSALALSAEGRPHDAETRILTFPGENGATHAIEYTIGISRLKSDAGERRRDRAERDGRFIACLTARDISERLSYEANLQRLSDFDDLTGAWRRHSFVRFLEATITESDACGHAIVAINLHRFKTVNIALGRETGNDVLRKVAGRLRSADGRVLGAARLGGDTFAILVGGVSDEAQALEAVANITSAIATPYAVNRGHAQVGVRAGVTLCERQPGETVDGDALLDRAEMALDEARASSGSRTVYFDKALADQRRRARIIERDLWQAMERDEFHLFYQMQVTLADGSPCGAEALIRWTHPELGEVSPADFVPIAEANGFITALDRWTLVNACKEAANWPDHLTVAVNLVPNHFTTDDVIPDVQLALEQSGIAPHRLTIEIIESEFLSTDPTVIDRIKALKDLGVRLALDDFGSGYSAMGYLSRLHFDKIKMDKQFIDDLTTNPETQGIFKSVSVLAEAFDMTLVCEGVETQEQATFLRLIGCDQGQGYLFSRPLAPEAFREKVGTGPAARLSA